MIGHAGKSNSQVSDLSVSGYWLLSLLCLVPRHDGVREDHAVAEHQQNRRERETQESIRRRLCETDVPNQQQSETHGKRHIVLPREGVLESRDF